MMEEKINLLSEHTDDHVAELSTPDTATDKVSSDYVKAQGDQPVINNSSGLPLGEKDSAEADEKLKYFQKEMRYTSGVAVVPAIISETPIASSDEDLSTLNLDTLTVEINQYLNVARYSVIEVGKRLILAKELVPHGEWYQWLNQNFNLTVKTANNFMRISERFGSNRKSISDLDISTFKPTQLIALLALPEGEEVNFIETKAAEGMPVADMSVKKLHSEIKKFSANLTHDESVSNQTSTELVAFSDIKSDLQETSTIISHTNSPQQTDIIYASTPAHDVEEALVQLFAAASFLLNADNLQSVVTASAEKDIQTFEQQLAQLAAILSKLQKYLSAWQDDPINKRPFDRKAILDEIIQKMALDSSRKTSDHVLALISSRGYAKLHDIPDDFLLDLLKKVRNFKRG